MALRSTTTEEILAFLSIVLHFCTVFSLQSIPSAPALFIFGASTVDAGKNNDLDCTAKANFSPYGINFPGGVATGRYSDGLIIPDFISQYLGLPLIPPFRSNPRSFEYGTNFAQAGSGMYNTTGNFNVLHPSSEYPAPLSSQVNSFQRVKQLLIAQKGLDSASRIIYNSILFIAIGDNDIVFTYFEHQLQENYTLSEFTDLLVSIYVAELQRLYEEGARKFVVVSMRPYGCTPAFLATNNILRDGECAGEINQALKEFNAKLQAALESLRLCLPSSAILFADIFGPMIDMTQDPKLYGFEVAKVSCCNFVGTLLNNANFTCKAGAITCNVPSSYLYWDAAHPSSHAYKLLADLLWNGSTKNIYPFNIGELAQYSYSQ